MRSFLCLGLVQGRGLAKWGVRLASGVSTVDEKEVGRFSGLSGEWWREDGAMKALRSMNRLRVPWIRDTLLQYRGQRLDPTLASPSRPLTGFRILDVGCGAGFLSEPLARLGASVLGIDPTSENILVAREHLKARNEQLNLVYEVKTVEELTGVSFDAVVASEVIEHVSSRETFVDKCLALTTSDGGCIFFTTISRTWMARVLAIFAAEEVLRILPRGMHDWNKFSTPEDLQFLLERNADCSVRLQHGMLYNPLTNSWSWIRDTNVNYALCAVKK